MKNGFRLSDGWRRQVLPTIRYLRMTPHEATGRHGGRDNGSSQRLAVLGYVFTLISLAAIVALHLPWLPIPVQAAGHSFTNLVGQEHRWTMFSADPRGVSIDLWAVLDHPDGSVTRWSITDESEGNELRFYRWVKWMETGVLQQPHDQLEGLAEWLESQAAKPVNRITLFGLLQEPGVLGGERPDPEVRVLFTLERDEPRTTLGSRDG